MKNAKYFNVKFDTFFQYTDYAISCFLITLQANYKSIILTSGIIGFIYNCINSIATQTPVQ